MSAHAEHRMHENSLAAHRAEEPKLSRRAQAILEWITKHGPRTDRQVMEGLGFREPNAVRPRITELLEPPYAKLMEVATIVCPVTKRHVRVVDIRKSRQEALFS